MPGDGQDGLVAEAEFETDDAEVSEELEAEFEGDDDIVVVVVVELSAKEQSARSLEIRRAIEERMDKRQLDDDLEYLDMDLDD